MSDRIIVVEQPAPVSVVQVEQPGPIEVVLVAQQGPPGPPKHLKTLDGQSLEGTGNIETRKVHEQTTPSDTWTINHGLGKFPSVTVVDSAGTWVIGELAYLDADTVQITFSCSFSGRAFLN